MSSIVANDLAAMLAAGKSHSEIAASLGVTQSAIAQAAKTDAVQNLLVTAKEKQPDIARDLDSRYDAVESALLAKFEQQLNSTFLKPAELLRAMATLNGMKRRTGALNPERPPATTVVQLIMPTQIVNKMQVSPQGEIVAIDGRDLITAQPAQVQKLLQDSRNESIADLL